MDQVMGHFPDLISSFLGITVSAANITKLLGLSVIVSALYLIYRHFVSKAHIEDFETDIVYIFVEPCHPKMLIMFPQSSQIEIFCLLHKIKYELINGDVKIGRFEKYPFIELNGYHTKGFVNIENRLRKHFDHQRIHKLQNEITAMTKATDAQFNNLIHRQKNRDTKYRNAVSRKLSKTCKRQTIIVLETAIEQNLNNLPSDVQNREDEKICMFLYLVQELIKGQKFMFGNNITTADIAVYSQIISVHFICPKSIVSMFIRRRYPSILDYLKRMQKEINLLRKNK